MAGPQPVAHRRPAWAPVVAAGVWLALWNLTPGLRADGVGSWFSPDELSPTVMSEV